jgi:hypothetical protein
VPEQATFLLVRSLNVRILKVDERHWILSMLSRCLIVLIFTNLLHFCAFTQTHDQKLDPNILAMLSQVSSTNIEATILKLVSFGTRNTLSDPLSKTRGIGAARDWIFDEFRKMSSDCGGCLDVQKQIFVSPKGDRIPAPTEIVNIVATLRGQTDPERVYVVSGHYDSMCNLDPMDKKCDAPGANDDGSGTATVIELARIFSKHKFRATLIFMTVAGEEQGLLGSRYFATKARDKKMNIDGMFTNDIIGGVTSYKTAPNRQSVRVFAEGVPTNETEAESRIRRSVGGENDSPSRQLGRYIKEMADLYLPNFKVTLVARRDRYLRGGDHISFLEQGFSAVRFTEPHEDYTHQHQSVKMVDGKQYGDLTSFVDFEYIANVCRVNLVALANMATAPGKPTNVVIQTKSLTNDTDLSWDSAKEPDVVGYEIVWRETTSPFWTDAKYIGNQKTYKAEEMSKDNYFFGVRAVDKGNHKSPVSFPSPGNL